jgi:hypothetical protein
MSPSSQTRPPLGLPSGSIRALLTLLIVAVVVVQLGRGKPLELLWAETLMITLAHYFTSRRFINLPPEAVRRLAEEGHVDTESNPLFLPRYSIRVILILAFAGLGWYLYQEDQLLHSDALPILGVVFAYLIGVVARFRGVRGWEDSKAIVILAVLVFTAMACLLDRSDMVPHHLQTITLGLVLFYFGSR